MTFSWRYPALWLPLVAGVSSRNLGFVFLAEYCSEVADPELHFFYICSPKPSSTLRRPRSPSSYRTVTNGRRRKEKGPTQRNGSSLPFPPSFLKCPIWSSVSYWFPGRSNITGLSFKGNESSGTVNGNVFSPMLTAAWRNLWEASPFPPFSSVRSRRDHSGPDKQATDIESELGGRYMVDLSQPDDSMSLLLNSMSWFLIKIPSKFLALQCTYKIPLS